MRPMLLFVVLVLGAASALALEFDNGGAYDASRHERFEVGTFPSAPVPNQAFFLAAHQAELSGIGWQTSAPQKKAALITPQHFLNADHFKLGESITFLGQDGNVHTYSIASNLKIAGDIAIGTLSEPIPAAHGVYFFPIVSVAGAEPLGREVVYLGGSPGGQGIAAGRSVIVYSNGGGSALDSSQVSPSFAGDRVRGVSGDSGGPSLLDEGGQLGLLGHHFASYNDVYVGYGAACDAVEDHLAADGYLLDVLGAGSLGDPADGGLAVTRLSDQGAVGFEAGALGARVTRTIRIHDFSGAGSDVDLSAQGAEFQILDPVSGDAVSQLTVSLPLNAAGGAVDIVFTAAAAGAYTGQLDVAYAAGGGAGYQVPLWGEAVDGGVGPLDLSVTPASQAGRSGADGIPGDTLLYTLGATNRDADNQSPASIVFSAEAPAGWSLAFDPSSLSLAPGASESVSLAVTPADSAVPSLYALRVRSRDAVEPAHDTLATLSYEVTEILQDVTPPSAPSGLTASGNWKGSQLTWTAASDDGRVAGYAVLRDGQRVGDVNGTQYVEGSVERGRSYVYRVFAIDAAGNEGPESASVTVVNGKVAGGDTTDPSDPPGGGEDPPACTPTRSKEVGRFCRDHVDNDCDGLIDANDPDC